MLCPWQTAECVYYFELSIGKLEAVFQYQQIKKLTVIEEAEFESQQMIIQVYPMQK